MISKKSGSVLHKPIIIVGINTYHPYVIHKQKKCYDCQALGYNNNETIKLGNLLLQNHPVHLSQIL